MLCAEAAFTHISHMLTRNVLDIFVSVLSRWMMDALPPFPGATTGFFSAMIIVRTLLMCFVIPAGLAETVLMVALYECPSNTCFSFCMDAAVFLHGGTEQCHHSKPLPQPWRYIYNSCSPSPSPSPSPSCMLRFS